MSGVTEQLPNISQWGGKVHLVRRYAVDGDKQWSAFNPSVQVDGNGDYWMVFRSSNYFFNNNHHIDLTTGNRVRNRLFIGKLNTATMKLDESTIKELDMKRLNPHMERGIEDARLFFDGKTWCLSATHLERDFPIASISVVHLKSLSNLEVQSFTVLDKPNTRRPEKNWMPIHKVSKAAKSKVDFLYNCTTIVSEGTFTKLPESKASAKFRGGTQLVPLDDGTYLSIIHETFSTEDNNFNTFDFAQTRKLRNYAHRFIRFDKNFHIVQASDQFVFNGRRIEFAAGLAPHKDGYIISFGSQDIASYVATISQENLLKQLKDL